MYKIRKGTSVEVAYGDIHGEAILLMDLPILKDYRNYRVNLAFRMGGIIYTSKNIAMLDMVEDDTYYIETISNEYYYINILPDRDAQEAFYFFFSRQKK